uniref:Uncharacterized protein LOC105643779 n=1 Tax=Rhizophora mucronata TaxID=61149 RepID=A0A2P2LVQ4_RHIMU
MNDICPSNASKVLCKRRSNFELVLFITSSSGSLHGTMNNAITSCQRLSSFWQLSYYTSFHWFILMSDNCCNFCPYFRFCPGAFAL